MGGVAFWLKRTDGGAEIPVYGNSADDFFQHFPWIGLSKPIRIAFRNKKETPYRMWTKVDMPGGGRWIMRQVDYGKGGLCGR